MADHAAGCSACASLWRAEEFLRACAPVPRVVVFPPALQRELERADAGRALPRRSPAVIMLVSLGAVLGALLLLSPRPDLGALAASELLPLVSAPLALSLAMYALSRHRGSTGLGVPGWLRWLCVGLALLAFPALAALQTAHSTLPLHAAPRDCLLLGLLSGVTLGGVALWLGRHSVLTAPRAAGALLGASVGYAAFTVLALHCPSRVALHVQVAHGLPLILLILAGTLWGRRWLDA